MLTQVRALRKVEAKRSLWTETFSGWLRKKAGAWPVTSGDAPDVEVFRVGREASSRYLL
jgi:hypothetical protein